MDVASFLAVVSGATVVGDPATEVTSLAYDSRRVAPGALFFCVPGVSVDGHGFAGEAVAGGAAGLVVERRLDAGVVQVVVPSVRRAMALMSARFFGDPTAKLRVVGVTGTNGKTTTAHLEAQILDAAGLRPALLGTVVNRIGGEETPVTLTTAESCDLQAMFARMVRAGDLSCAMEVSSHALALERVAGIDFAAVVFTNLTRDHLDFHSDIDDYFLAKRRLFLPGGERRPRTVAVANAGDAYGRRLADECREAYGDDLWTFAVRSTDERASDGAAIPHVAAVAQATATAEDLDLRADGSSFTLRVPRLGIARRVELRLAAHFNVANGLAAATAALAIGLPLDAVVAGLESTAGVPGRFEAVRAGQPFTVLVDYSHTPDSLENALRAARDVAAGRLLCVFGCGGDRDRGKRPLMGEVASRLADLAVVTSDNPRSEDPLAIIEEVLAGVHREATVVEPDRRAAITLAVEEARPGDVVLIAGKGHERGQIIGRDKIPFDDREVALEALRRAGYGTAAADAAPAARGGRAAADEGSTS
jgi:UDP-N-acetylmuramoyl-L-alanyl-D-glutamate--2,6-diaminopimelate ligase